MFKRLIPWGTLVTAVAVLAVGCAPTPAAPPAIVAAPSSTNTATPLPTVAPTAVSQSPTPTAAPAAVPSTGGASTGDAIRFVLVPQSSEARFRVREQLAGNNLPSDAVGRTQDFTGTLVVNPDGSIMSSDSQFVVNMGTLVSDQPMRDNFLRGNVLQVNQYPKAVFVPKQVSGLPSPLPQSGSVTFKLTGDLTVRNVTKPVAWDVTAQVQGNQVTAQAATAFTFEDFTLTQPRIGRVLSIEDNIKLELDVTLQRQ